MDSDGDRLCGTGEFACFLPAVEVPRLADSERVVILTGIVLDLGHVVCGRCDGGSAVVFE